MSSGFLSPLVHPPQLRRRGGRAKRACTWCGKPTHGIGGRGEPCCSNSTNLPLLPDCLFEGLLDHGKILLAGKGALFCGACGLLLEGPTQGGDEDEIPRSVRKYQEHEPACPGSVVRLVHPPGLEDVAPALACPECDEPVTFRGPEDAGLVCPSCGWARA